MAIVKIELNGTKSAFTMNTTDREEIAAEIFTRKGLTSELRRQYIEFENEVLKHLELHTILRWMRKHTIQR